MSKNKILYLLSIFTLLSFSIFTLIKNSTTLQFEQRNINVPGYARFGEVHFAFEGKYQSREQYILPKKYQQYHTIRIDIKNPKVTQIRIDPLIDIGEIYIRNVLLIKYNGFKKIITKISLDTINSSFMHHIKIITKNKNEIYLKAVGKDPYFILSNNIQLEESINYYHIIISLILAFGLTFILFLLYFFLSHNPTYVHHYLTIFSILLYSLHVFLLGKYETIANLLLFILPLINMFYFYKFTILRYKHYLYIVIIILTTLTALTMLSNYSNHINYFSKYQSFLPSIISALFIPLIFIYKENFNYIFYKKVLSVITLFFGSLILILHYKIVNITHIILFDFPISQSAWANKNYSIWYLILMWSTISFLNIKKKNDRYIILLILTISMFSLTKGYSQSAPLAFFTSLSVYILFSLKQFTLKALLIIPALLSFYLIATPWITEGFGHLSQIHPKLNGARHAIFTIYPYMIKEHFFMGYGFNSCPSLHPSNFVSTEIINEFKESHYLKVCSPHTLPLVIWLNFGLLGALALSFYIYKSIKFLIIKTYQSSNQASLLSLITAFIIFSTFSWGSWYSHKLLTYGYFIGMILLSLNINRNK